MVCAWTIVWIQGRIGGKIAVKIPEMVWRTGLITGRIAAIARVTAPIAAWITGRISGKTEVTVQKIGLTTDPSGWMSDFELAHPSLSYPGSLMRLLGPIIGVL